MRDRQERIRKLQRDQPGGGHQQQAARDLSSTEEVRGTGGGWGWGWVWDGGLARGQSHPLSDARPPEAAPEHPCVSVCSVQGGFRK